jgi:hypothetical protein
MDDRQIIETIDRLVAEERQLRQQHASEPLGSDEAARLRSLEESLDQCWDLLRQRRARRQYGEDADEAAVRNPSVVEGYRQ